MSASSNELTHNDDPQRLQNEVVRLEKERKENQIKWAKEKALLEQKCEFITLEVKELQTKLKQSEEYCRLIVQFTDEGKGSQQTQVPRANPGNQEELELNYKKQLKSKDEIINQQKDFYESQIDDLQKRINMLMQNDINLKQNIATTLNTTQTIESLTEQLKTKEASLERCKQEYFYDKKRTCEEFESQIEALNIQQKKELCDAEMKYQQLVDSFKLTEDERMKYLETAHEKERRKMRQTALESKQTEEDLRTELQSVMTLKCQLEDSFHSKERNLLNQLNQAQQKVKVLEQLNESRLDELRQCTKEKEIQFARQLTNSEQLVEELKNTIVNREQRIAELDRKYHELAIQLTIHSQEAIATNQQTYQEKSLMDQLKREQLKEIEIKNERIQQLSKDIGNLKATVEALKAQGIQKDTVYNQEIIQERHKYTVLKEKYEREQVEILQQQENVVSELKMTLNSEKQASKVTTQKLEKSSKDTESKLQGEIAALQVECHQQREQINKQYEQMMQMGMKENSSSATNQTLNSSLQNAQAQLEMVNKQRNAMQGQCQQLQEQLVQMQQSANTMKVLAEQKIQFLEAQKDRAKKDLVDAQMKFQQVLLKLQEVRKNEKKDQQESSKALIDALERRYEQKIIDLKAEYSSNLAYHSSSIGRYNQPADSHDLLPQIVKATLSVTSSNAKQSSPSLSSVESANLHEGEVLKDNQNAMNYGNHQTQVLPKAMISPYNYSQQTPATSSQAFLKITESQGSSSIFQQSQNSPPNSVSQEQSSYQSRNYSPLKLNTPISNNNNGNATLSSQQQCFESSIKAVTNSTTNNKPSAFQIDSPFTPVFNGAAQSSSLSQQSLSTKDFYSPSNIDKIVSDALGRAKAIASGYYQQGSSAHSTSDQSQNIRFRG